ncbi:hypothetical protein GCM10010330_67240 [Streptomyces tendae]|uniref:hypothetical protein n=1 Tax=Streptomyces tendae TaxID=1932 RepID=UPI00167ABE2C|nr:hypothetical protein [Streptomyces tendae]GHB03539.1 hypothetical protein GCM10010330_67240 [Streptomyces tendae]
MTDVVDPGAGLDLDGFIPVVDAVDGADAELVAIGERYWALAGFDTETPVPTPVWCEKTSAIDTLGWGRSHYAVAAAGVRATITGQQCHQCEGPLSLTSRTALAQLIGGGSPTCVECTPSLLNAIEIVLDPRRKAKRERARQEAEAQQVRDAARTRWQQAQRDTMDTRYALKFSEQVPSTSVRQMTAALALLRYAPSTTPVSRVGGWVDPLHPSYPQAVSLLGELVRSRLIRIHPSTPVTALVWEPETFEQAQAQAENGEIPEPETAGDFFPLDTHFYAPFATSMGTGAEHLDSVLTQRLNPHNLTAGQHDDLVAVAEELIAEEALRYFNGRLEDLNLPAVTDQHVQRLREAVYRAAAHRPLGEVYNLAWRATRAAAEAAQKTPRAPRTHMSTHAVNRLETDTQRAASDPDWQLKPFDEVTGYGLSAMIRTLFYTVLNLNPVSSSLNDIIQALPEPAPESVPPAAAPSAVPVAGTDDAWAEMAIWMATDATWKTEAVQTCLTAVIEDGAGLEYDVDERVARRNASQLRDLHDRLTPAIGPRQAAIAVLASARVLTHPVTPPGPGAGTLVHIGKVLHMLLALAVLESADDGTAPEGPRQ